MTEMVKDSVTKGTLTIRAVYVVDDNGRTAAWKLVFDQKGATIAQQADSEAALWALFEEALATAGIVRQLGVVREAGAADPVAIYWDYFSELSKVRGLDNSRAIEERMLADPDFYSAFPEIRELAKGTGWPNQVIRDVCNAFVDHGRRVEAEANVSKPGFGRF